MNWALASVSISVVATLAGCAANPSPTKEDARPRCEVHGQVLAEKTVQVTYGLPDDFYVDQRLARFPHVEEAFGGCVVPARRETRQVQVCEGCETASREFHRNYSAEWAAYMASFDENSRESGETLEEAERSPDEREAERADEGADERSEESPTGD